jgi:hypothetical protein
MTRQSWFAAVTIPVAFVLLLLACRAEEGRPTDPAAGAPSGDVVSTPPSPPPGTSTTGGAPAGGTVLRFRFNMIDPPNEDFAVKDPDIFFYVRPFEDYLSMRVQGREQNRVQVMWNDSEFEDIIGRRYKLVPQGVTLDEAAFGIVPPTEISPGGIFTGKVILLDPTRIASMRTLGGEASPIVPPDAGTPEQIRGKLFRLRLAVDLNYVRSEYEFVFEIQDIFFR